MNYILLGCIFVSILLTIFLILSYTRGACSFCSASSVGVALQAHKGHKDRAYGIEGFSTQNTTTNALLNLMSQLKRVTGTLTNVDMWKDRIEMASMSPVELARRYLKSQSKAE